MAELLMCTRPMPASQSASQANQEQNPEFELFNKANALSGRASLQPYTPYLVPSELIKNRSSLSPITQLPIAQRQKLAFTASEFGDMTVAISEFYNDHFLGGRNADWQGATGAALGAMNDRMSAFSKALTQYQERLLALRAAKRSGQTGLGQLEAQVRQAHNTLNQYFQREMKKYAAKVRSRRGTVLSNSQRGINIARDSRHATKLMLNDTAQIRNLSRFTQGINHVGKGFLVLDIAAGVGTVVQDRRDGKDWHRSAVMETVGISSGVAIGSLVTKAVVSGLTIALGATPVGWAIAIGVGLTAGFVAGSGGSNVARGLADELYSLSSEIDWF